MTTFNPARFIREVRQEMTKVTWPSRKETLSATGMTLLLVVAAAAFFTGVDSLIQILVRLLLGIY